MANSICNLCKGFQNLTWSTSTGRKWMKCPACFGSGVDVSGRMGPPEIKTGLTYFFEFMKESNIVSDMTMLDGAVRFISIQDCPTKAELGVRIGKFPSLTQARKNGWTQPLNVGDSFIIKKIGQIKIVE